MKFDQTQVNTNYRLFCIILGSVPKVRTQQKKLGVPLKILKRRMENLAYQFKSQTFGKVQIFWL